MTYKIVASQCTSCSACEADAEHGDFGEGWHLHHRSEEMRVWPDCQTLAGDVQHSGFTDTSPG